MILPKVYLASTSPRRRELLAQIGVEFDVVTIDVDESHHAGETAQAYVQRVASEKALAGWRNKIDKEPRPVIGADTAVVIEGQVLGKPRDDNDAKAMLSLLSGQTHQVMSCVAVVSNGDVTTKTNISEVTFSTLDHDMIAWYIATEEGKDKAGSYAVQGLAAMLIEHISGSYSGIMGLPLQETSQLLLQYQ